MLSQDAFAGLNMMRAREGVIANVRRRVRLRRVHAAQREVQRVLPNTEWAASKVWRVAWTCQPFELNHNPPCGFRTVFRFTSDTQKTNAVDSLWKVDRETFKVNNRTDPH